MISYLEERQPSMWALISHHNTVVNPTNKIKAGDIVTFKWQDGSSEKATVGCSTSAACINPIPGTQSQPAGGGLGYTTDSNGGSLGGIGVIGFTPIYTTVQICIGADCWQTTVISGYSYIFGNTGPNNNRVV